jgi:transposase-like protein
MRIGECGAAEGRVPVRVPQVRDTGEVRSTLMGFLEGNSEVLERLVMEMYARGLSTRNVEDAFRGLHRGAGDLPLDGVGGDRRVVGAV